ncbi:hypothetical protein EPK99_11835 [Neorhizobium lilium]|uniref:Adenylyl-sulfate kinase n=1 Tax=Neorhizobium lilium TaxID=2503024 RepID=A0A3S3S872_9HYPH|nr:AAA family ATPase [Neorhizobium lilium]RWX79242.1 hypothetical protein EPK99_11835 [Neorhizobium lilium]
MLIIFGELPGSGKSTIAQSLAREIKALYLRVDSLEQAIRSSGMLAADVGPAGYMAMYRVAADNLRLGHVVIVDSVNPIEITRTAFQEVALHASAPFLEVEVVCSDVAIHRHRVETRFSPVEGLTPPTWREVEMLEYEPWIDPHIRLDTALLSVEQSVAKVVAAIQSAAAQAKA